MASIASSLTLPPNFAFNSKYRQRSRFQIRSLGGEDSAVLSQTPVRVNGVSLVAKEEETFGGLIDRVNGELVSIVEENNNKANNNKKKKNGENVVLRKLEPLWDDGYGTYTVKDYLDLAKDVIKPDGGPPRWFCPVPSGPPLEDSPVLLFLPGMDGLGFGLILHQKALGKVFEVRCLHIPVQDRTPFRDLVKLVEQTVRTEHASSPNKPIYIVGDSLGGCLALAVAARVPTIDLVIILANPATSFGSSQLQPLFPLLEAIPNELHSAVPYLLSCVMGNPLKMATVSIDTTLPPEIVLNQLSGNLTALLPRLSTLAEIIPKDTLLWKLKLLGVASAYANSRLHAVTAEVLVLASGQDNMLPSRDEAQRLSTSLKNCKIYNFNGNGHTILLEDGVNLLTIIKGTCKYRRSKKRDFVKDFIPPSMSEYKLALEEHRLFRVATSPVMFSTMEDGTVIRGLAGVPNEGPVLLVGYHMLLGLELPPLVLEFLREKNLMIRGLAHPTLFSTATESESRELSIVESLKVFGAVPVTPTNLFNLLAAKSHALLYPGGAREALHRKGEEYTLFWPEEQEFVRMAAKFGATVVPFGAVGEDDIVDLVLDYDDIMAIPLVNDFIRKHNEQNIRLRADKSGEVANQDFYPPGLLPKIPGRFYYMFGKPIETKGKEEVMKNKASAKELYLKIKSEVENCMGYLIKKRGEDPYRNIVDRTLYSVVSTPIDQIPTFKP